MKDVVTRDFIITLCRGAGQTMLEGLGANLEITRKGEVDLVTQMDVALQETMVEEVQESGCDETPSGVTNEMADTQQSIDASGASARSISSAVYMIVALFGLLMAAVAVALYRKI